MTRKSYNPSAQMTAYNTVKSQGKRSGLWTPERVDRALGYLMDGNAVLKWAEYATTPDSCECPDSQYRQQVCKHSLAMLIDQQHDDIMDEFRTPKGASNV